MGIKFNTKPYYGNNEIYIKTKLKTNKSNITTNFYHKKVSEKVPKEKEKIPHKCLPIIILDFILFVYEKYYPKIFLEECKYAEENIKTKNYIGEELKLESDNNSDSDSGSDSDSDSDSVSDTNNGK